LHIFPLLNFLHILLKRHSFSAMTHVTQWTLTVTAILAL
jgi:hypothetical protein